MTTELINRDSKGLIRYIRIEVTLEDEKYKINRFSGLLGGAEITQPYLHITKGKASRTIEQQKDLELASIINKYKAKGYKDVHEYTPKLLKDLTQEEVCVIFPKEVTDDNGNIKPMLAKATDNLKRSAWERYWFISKKLDGVRCIMQWDTEKQEVRTISRGGKNFDAATQHIRSSAKLIKLLKDRPNIKLDGELYCHGVSLEYLSGTARLKVWEKRCEILEFHCYDLAMPNMQFQKRLELLDKLRGYFIDEKKICVLTHTAIHGYKEAKAFHDLWVGEGYEGAILRDGTKDYGFNKRDIRMIKLKEFTDIEGTITGYTPGLRGAEDMVFNMVLPSGVVFDAKPMGSKQLKEEYALNIDKIIGKQGTVKYFYLTEEGKPFLPVFKCIRDYE